MAGKQVSVEIFKKCQDVEKQGGMLTKKEDRRRMPGGVFMQLFSEREDIKEEQKVIFLIPKLLNIFLYSFLERIVHAWK